MTKTINTELGRYQLTVKDNTGRKVAIAQETAPHRYRRIGTCQVLLLGAPLLTVTDRSEAEKTVDAALQKQFGVALADVPDESEAQIKT